MKSTFAILAAGVVAATAAAVPAEEYEFLDIVPIYARQNTSPEKLLCHQACGPAITEGQNGTAHCSSDEWKENFDYCMECALEFDIWQHYGDGVTHAADACDIAINLKSNGTESTTSTETTAAAASTPTNDDSAASHMAASSVGILFAMIAAAGLL